MEISMNSFARIALLSAMALASPVVLRAQTPAAPMVLVGGAIGTAIGSESADLSIYADGDDCGRFESGTSASASIDARMVLPTFFAPSVGVDARLRIGFGNARLTATPLVPTTVRDADDGSLVTLDREFLLERNMFSATIDMLARVSVSRLHLGGGLAIGTRIAPSIRQTDNVYGPGAHRFPDGQSSRPMTPTDAETSVFIIAPMLVAGYALPLGARTQLVPEIGARFDLMSSSPNGAWRSTELTVGAAILFDVTVTGSPITPGPTNE
jgi:hypothetical protein